MADVTTETQSAKKFDPEAFAMNLARAMESSGQAPAAYLKPRENGEIRDKPPSELSEVIKTFSTVAEFWLSDETRAAELQSKLGKAYVDLWGSTVRRMAGEDAKPGISPSPADRRFGHEDAGGGNRGRSRPAAHPSVRSRQSRRRRQHGDDAGQGDLPERADAAHSVCAVDGKRAAHAASDRAAVDQQI